MNDRTYAFQSNAEVVTTWMKHQKTCVVDRILKMPLQPLVFLSCGAMD